jgi:prepilin-type processing-associated H-X9-DG protein
MPSVFSCPSDPTLKKGLTGYRVVIGPDMAFRSDFQPRKIDDFFTDGTSNTILVGESLETVPWTKPDELRFDNNLPMNGFGSHHGYHNNGLNVLLADGSVRFIRTSMSREVIRAYLTPAGNEVISGHEY